jgi:4-hydroxy-2-oxoglutarate aldolase
VLGSTGERVHLDEGEYFTVIAAAHEEVAAEANGLMLIAGAGRQSTRATINEIEKVAALGVEAVLVITPHFYRSAITQEALVDYYEQVADQSPVPVILYSMPALTGIKIEPETAARLSSHQNIIGIKDSSTDIERLQDTVRLSRADFAVLTGNGTVLCDALRAGACGAILAVGCVVPALCLEILRAVQAGDSDRAAALQAKLKPLAEAVTTHYGIGGLKAALDLIGYVGGEVRMPLRGADKNAREEIASLLSLALAALDNDESIADSLLVRDAHPA